VVGRNRSIGGVAGARGRPSEAPDAAPKYRVGFQPDRVLRVGLQCHPSATGHTSSAAPYADVLESVRKSQAYNRRRSNRGLPCSDPQSPFSSEGRQQGDGQRIIEAVSADYGPDDAEFRAAMDAA